MSQPFNIAAGGAPPADVPVKPIGFDPNLVAQRAQGTPPVIQTYQPSTESEQQQRRSAPAGVPAAGAVPVQPIGFQQPSTNELQGAPPKIEIYQPSTGSKDQQSAPPHQPQQAPQQKEEPAAQRGEERSKDQ